MSGTEKHNDADGLEDFFNKNLYDASMQPSKMPWEGIETALDLEEKEKRKKRFFWFFLSGFILLVGTTAAWFFMPNNSSKDFVTSKNNHPTEQIVTENATLPTLKEIEKSTDNSLANKESVASDITTTTEKEQKHVAENNISIKKIQLGAFSKKISLDKFKEVPFDVQSETGEDGITRYFVASENVNNDLNLIKQVGFKDAFIKNHETTSSGSLAMNENSATQAKHSAKKNISVSETTQKPNLAVASKNKSSETDGISQSSNKTQTNISKVESHGDQPTAISTTHDNPATVASISVASSAKNSGSVKDESPANATAHHLSQTTNNVSPTSEESKTQSNSSDAGKSAESLAATNNSSTTDSIPKEEPDSKIMPDSVKQIAKTDSVMHPVKEAAKKDSAKIIPDSRWAIALIGGPNIYLNQAKTQLFDPKTEKQKITYGGEVKAEYRFTKSLSGSIGIGYQSQSIQKDSTRFTFSKYMTNDYVVNSSFGPMAIDNTTLMQGFFMIAPVDSFFAAYKYNSTIQSVNVPLQLNWYFLNKSRLKLYSSVGVNANYIVSQKSHLTLIKEHHVDDLFYKNIQANKLNAILLLSLGCDVRITKRFYFTLAPSYRYALTNYSSVSGIVFKPSYISATGGFKFRF